MTTVELAEAIEVGPLELAVESPAIAIGVGDAVLVVVAVGTAVVAAGSTLACAIRPPPTPAPPERIENSTALTPAAVVEPVELVEPLPPAPIVPVPEPDIIRYLTLGDEADEVRPPEATAHPLLAPADVELDALAFADRVAAVPDGSAPEHGFICRYPDRQIIRDGVDRESLKPCWDFVLSRDPNAEGHLSLRFEIEDGQVVEAEVVDSVIGDGQFHRCVARAALTWSFPPVLTEMTVTYPFVFANYRS